SGKFAGQPQVEAAIRRTIGDTYHSLGLTSKGLPHTERAVELLRGVLGPERPQTLSAMNCLAVLYRVRGRYEEAEALYTHVLDVQRRVLGPEHSSTLATANNLAVLYESRGAYVKAEKLHTQVLEVKRRALGPEHPDTLVTMYNLAAVYDK